MNYEKELRNNPISIPNPDIVFPYGWGLIRSRYINDRLKGIQLLNGI